MYNPKSRRDPDYTEIIKPTLENEHFQKKLEEDHEIEIFTPSIKKYLNDLQKLKDHNGGAKEQK